MSAIETGMHIVQTLEPSQFIAFLLLVFVFFVLGAFWMLLQHIGSTIKALLNHPTKPPRGTQKGKKNRGHGAE